MTTGPLNGAPSSLCVQSHVGSAGAVGVLLMVAVGAFVVQARRGASSRRTALVSVFVGIVLWLPPLIDEFRPHGGNLSALWRYWTAAHAHLTGWARATRIVNAQFAVPAPWMTAHERTAPFAGGLAPAWHVPWTLLLLVAAGIVALHRHDWPSATLVAIVIVTAMTAVISTSGVVDEPYSYLLRWTWTLGALAWLAIAWTALRVLAGGPTLPRIVPPVVFAAGFIAVVLAVATTVTALQAHLPDEQTEHALSHFSPALLAIARRAPSPILIENAPDLVSASLATGVLLELNRHGIAARTDRDLGARGAGTHYTIDRRDAQTTILTAANDAIDSYNANPAYRRIASYDALQPAERAFVTKITDQMTKDLGPKRYFIDLDRWADQHPDRFKRFTQLSTRDHREALYIVRNP
jgi:hypothetical protein